jgi:hypothetical protein
MMAWLDFIWIRYASSQVASKFLNLLTYLGILLSQFVFREMSPPLPRMFKPELFQMLALLPIHALQMVYRECAN